jgi:uncharacterized protein (TIGR03086 family)
MDGMDIFKSALEQATTVVKQVRPEHFSNATPDTDWSVRDLIGHTLYELVWTPDILEGKTIEEVGAAHNGNLVGDSDIELSIRWQSAADKAEEAVDGVDPDETVHLSFADMSAEEYLAQAGTDQLIHAWDLGRAIGVPVKFDIETAQAMYDDTLPKKEGLKQSGLFADPLTVSDDADIQTKLLALYGRDANWRPPTS